MMERKQILEMLTEHCAGVANTKENGFVATKVYLDDLADELFKNLTIPDVEGRYDSEVFVPPFRLGRKQKRAILDAKGREVIIMPRNSQKQAQMYCDYLNGL